MPKICNVFTMSIQQRVVRVCTAPGSRHCGSGECQRRLDSGGQVSVAPAWTLLPGQPAQRHPAGPHLCTQTGVCILEGLQTQHT